jgi:diguanylate cyclase (GGDEF)-like protein/PAS domain S-box-containing protein
MSVYPPQRGAGRERGLLGVPDELNTAVAARLRGALPVLAVIYLLAAVYPLLSGLSISVGPGEDTTGGVRMSCLAGFCILLIWMLLRRDRIWVARMHLVAAGVCGVALLQGLVSLRLSGRVGTDSIGPATVVFLIIAGSGATLFSLRWHAVVTVISLAGWLLAVRPILPAPTLLYWSVVLLAVALLSALNLQYRLWKFSKNNVASAAPPCPVFAKEFQERAVEGTLDGLWYWELQADVFHFSPAWATLLGFQPGELASHPDEWMNRVHPGYLARLQAELAAHLYGNKSQFRNEHRIRRKDGVYVWVLARGTVMRNAAGEPIVLAGSHCDITPIIEAEKRLLTDAFSDALTGLPNRSFLLGHLQRAVEEKCSRGSAAPLFAVLFLDLDRFKFVNDTMGHDVGDQLLKAVAARLKNCGRPDDVVARFGGDEFVLLLRNLRDPEEAVHVGTRILKALSTPFQLGERTVQSGGSVGIALSRESFSQCDEILRFGDIAMYQAKSLRDGQVKLFHPAMLENSNAQAMLRNDLENALKHEQMVLHYQPFIHMASGKIVGAEALIRWQRSPGELLYPVDFLPLAEKAGLIQEMGEWALRTACAQNSAWQRAGVSPIRMAVNLSASQLQQRDLPRFVQRVLAETGLKPEWLELELTESVLMRCMDVAPATLKSLSESGIRASIDDFGSGHASLNFLRQIQFHTMKMDRSFVSEITTDAKAAAVARGLIALAHSLDLSVVAAGVEKDDQLQFLSGERCDRVQGYLTGRPMPGDEMLALLRSGRSLIAAPPGANLENDLARLNSTHANETSGSGSAALNWASERTARTQPAIPSISR